MAGDEGEHDNEYEMQHHGYGKAPGYDDNPGAIAQWLMARGIDVRRAFGGDDAYGDAQAQRREHRRTAHFYEEGLVTAFTKCP